MNFLQKGLVEQRRKSDEETRSIVNQRMRDIQNISQLPYEIDVPKPQSATTKGIKNYFTTALDSYSLKPLRQRANYNINKVVLGKEAKLPEKPQEDAFDRTVRQGATLAKGMGENFNAGIGKFSQGFNEALNAGIKYVPYVGEKFEEGLENQRAFNNQLAMQGQKDVGNVVKNDFTRQAINSLSTSSGQMAVDALITAITAAGSKAPKIAKYSLTAFQKFANMLKLPKEAIPLFISNTGNAYNEAKQNGASDIQAINSAIISAYPQTMIEHSGGYQDILKNEVKEGFFKTLYKTAKDEALEEVTQYPFNEMAKLPYAPLKTLSMDKEEQALINPKAQLESGLLGGIGGALFGGAMAIGKLSSPKLPIKQNANISTENAILPNNPNLPIKESSASDEQVTLPMKQNAVVESNIAPINNEQPIDRKIVELKGMQEPAEQQDQIYDERNIVKSTKITRDIMDKFSITKNSENINKVKLIVTNMVNEYLYTGNVSDEYLDK